jgi:transcriptional regulator with XRE-family HTH domain
MAGENDGNTSQRVAAEIRRVREAAGLSQDQMAERLGLGYAPDGRKRSTGRATVSLWESGKRPVPPQYLKVYADLGGEPAILAPQSGSPPSEKEPEMLPTYQAAGSEPLAADSAGPAPTAGMRGRISRRRLLLAVSSVVVAAAAAAGCVAALNEGGPSGPSGPVSTWTETTGTPAHTWADPVQLTGAGTPLGPRQSVQVLCRVRGYVVQDGDPWWYRLASTPWNGRYYATSDAFYNNGATSGSVVNGVVVDEQVPVCPGGS